MTSYTYSGDPRNYPSLGLEVADGDAFDFEADPPSDGRWAPTATAPTAPPVATPEPVLPEPPADPTNPDPTKD